MMDHKEPIAKAAIPLEHPSYDAISAYGRLHRLFAMLDTNHYNTVNVSEFFLPFLGSINPGTNLQGRNA